MPTKCPKCGFECVVDKVSVVCPNCDYVKIKEDKWAGEHIKCPKCDNKKARVYKSLKEGHTFVCHACNTIGRLVSDKNLKKKAYERTSPEGKKLSWLFEVPCKFWHKKEEIYDTLCQKCEIRQVCDEHTAEIERFCKKNDVEVYFMKHFIEVVHK